MKNVLILTETNVGEGHYQAAKALKDEFLEQMGETNVDVLIVSGMRFVHPAVERLSIITYFSLLRTCPKCWGWLYKKTKRPTFVQRYYFAFKLLSLIEQFKPHIVICTHPACIPALAQIKRWNTHSFLFVNVFTDFGFHPYAIQREVDVYFTPNQWTKMELTQKYAVDPQRVHQAGIPLRKEFETGYEGSNVRILKNHKRFQLLMMGGATGYGSLNSLVTTISRSCLRCDIIVITGKNKQLYNRLVQKKLPRVNVLGYVHNMKYWYEKADVILSKPGGLTIAEALSCCTPILVLQPIPGREESNRTFLKDNGILLEAEHLEQIPRLIQQWMHNPQPLKDIKDRMKKWKTNQAAKQIVNRIIALEREREEQSVRMNHSPATVWLE